MQAVDELNLLLGIGPPRVKLPVTLEKSGYQAVRPVGKGGFGQAHLIFHKRQQQYYVAKHVNMASMSSKQRKEAHNEIKMLQQLQHPNIVRYVEYVEEHPHLYIVMEYADGGDLFSHLKKVAASGKLLSEDQVMALFTQTAMAVKHMHDRRMLHRDIKAQNVFLTKAHVVKLGDFGISTVLNSTMAMAQTMCGTPCYFSPELCAGKPYNNKSDIWALGVLLYEICCVGDLPFEGANVKSLMDEIVKKEPRRVPKEFGDDIADLVRLMLQKDPKLRPDINGVLMHRAVQRACPTLVAQLGRLAPPPSAAPAARTPLSVASKDEPTPPAPPPRAHRQFAVPEPPARVHREDHTDIRDVMLAEPPAPAAPAAAPAAAGGTASELQPHKHFADTHADTGYKPALLQAAARAAAAADDDAKPLASLNLPQRQPAGTGAAQSGRSRSRSPGRVVHASRPNQLQALDSPRDYDGGIMHQYGSELGAVVQNLQSMTSVADEAGSVSASPMNPPPPLAGAPAPEVVDDETSTVTRQSTTATSASFNPQSSAYATSSFGGAGGDTDFEDPLGTVVDKNALETAAREAHAAAAQQFSASHQPRLTSPSAGDTPAGKFNRTANDGGAAKAASFALRLSVKQKNVLRSFAARSGISTGSAAAAAAAAAASSSSGDAGLTTSSGGAGADDEDDDVCIGGHCLCGATVYAGWLSMAVGTFTCGCMACRRFTGSAAGAEWIHFPEVPFTELLQQSPDVKRFVVVDGAIEHYFCGECGSSLAMLHENIEGCIVARATLSDSSAEVFAEATRAAASSQSS